MCLVVVVVRRYIYRFPHIPYILLFVSTLFCSSIPTYCSFKKNVFVLVPVHFCYLFNNFSRSINKHKGGAHAPEG